MISFCIISDGREPDKLDAEIESIRAMDDNAEIIVAGDCHMSIDADVIVSMPNTAKQGRLGALRNGAVSCASGDIIVVTDDDMLFHDGWISAVEDFRGGWDVMSCRILNPDGSRYWDWKAHENGRNWLLDYSEQHPNQSMTGGLTILKREVWDVVKWDDELGFNQAEDVDFTNRLKRAGMRIVMNPAAVITHDAGYTQRGVGVFKEK